MSESHDMDGLVERVSSLEAAYTRLRARVAMALLAALVIALLAVYWLPWSRPVVRAQRFVLTDRYGQARGELAVAGGGGMLTLRGREPGIPMALFVSEDGEPSITLRGLEKTRRLGPGQ